MLLLPLKSDLGDVSRVLGCFVAHGEVGRSPRRFDVVGAKIRPIMAPATLPQATLEEPLEVITKIQGSTDTSMPMDRPKDFKEVSYLRLIKTDD